MPAPTAVRSLPSRDGVTPPDLSQPAAIDVQAIKARIARETKRWGTLRLHRATFQTPWPLSREAYERERKHWVDTWLAVQEKRGFVLRSKVHIDGPFPAYGPDGDWFTVPLLGQRQFRVEAAFSMPHPKTRRIELYVAEPTGAAS